MTTKEILEKMTDYDIIDILIDLGSDEPAYTRDGLLFNTICHNEPGTGKKKLHYHSETKTFFCYTECGNIGNIFQLVMKTKDCQFRDAYEYVCGKLGIPTTTLKYGFTAEKIDLSFIRKFDNEEKVFEMPKPRNEDVLNQFWPNLFHQSWIDDFISIEVMKLFGIRFDISGNRIIIPHYDENNVLVGIRCRNLDEEKVEQGKKYMPIVVNDELYNYETSTNLFGLHINKQNILKYKKILIGESEKFVMQHRTFYEDSIAVALGGSSISDYHIQLLQKYNVEEVILALDKEFENEEEEKDYKKKIQKSFIDRLSPYFMVSIIWDVDNELELKMSPADKGKETFESLYRKRILL